MRKDPSVPEHAPPPRVQRSCALCGNVDDGPRREIVTDEAGGRRAWYHVPGSPDCGVKDADPYPELGESPDQSQLRHAMTQDVQYPTPDRSEVIDHHSIDASDPNAEIVAEGA